VENEAGRTNPKTADQEQPEDKTEDGQGRQPNTWSLDEMDDEWLPNEDLSDLPTLGDFLKQK